MLKIKAIDHIVLRTNKLDEMLNFYCQVLGCHIERETEDSLGLTQLRAGNALIDIVTIDSELGQMGGAAPSDSGINVDHFCLQLELISEQDIAQHLKNHHIPFNGFERRYGAQGYGQSVYIKDPQGNTVELRSTQ
ncbi:VOC family protein [Thalassotalea hakodatensis]|uniref:VOC family protein n=1 Tax=Thalassotalea hakodatensis TaxID=3030492 RepID=UPI002573CEC2|nr:VOC family protein [Thalassotalea hakodatensis]